MTPKSIRPLPSEIAGLLSGEVKIELLLTSKPENV